MLHTVKASPEEQAYVECILWYLHVIGELLECTIKT